MEFTQTEKLAAEVHALYCDQYLIDHGEPYWTGGDYSKLDEHAKQYDRNIALWLLVGLEAQRTSLFSKALRLFSDYLEEEQLPIKKVRTILSRIFVTDRS